MAAEPMTPEQAEAMAARILADALRPARWWPVTMLAAPVIVPLAVVAGVWHGLASGLWLAGAMAETLANHLALHVYLRERQFAAWRGRRAGLAGPAARR